ncbi:MAG: AIM24 family protein [Candidatus Dormibacteraeota bacterium]|nr:AIM24 family protein [Candidatus Dormibacteraeota bacterium]
MSAYTCRWCRMASDLSTETACPYCGAPVDVREAVSDSGWTELPAIKDMTRLQFGRSRCQIEGTLVPVADFNLAEGDGVYFAHHVLLWRDPQVQFGTMPLAGGWKRMMAGLPVVMTIAHGPGHIAFSRDSAGEVIALPLQQGGAIDVVEHLFMAATTEVEYSWFSSNVWYSTQNGDETETHYPMGMYVDRFHAPRQPGLVLLHAAGNAFVKTLAAGETMLIKPNSLLFKDWTVQMQLHFEYPHSAWSPWRSWSNRYLLLRVFGPGRVAIMSEHKHFEDPARGVYRSSPATQRHW